MSIQKNNKMYHTLGARIYIITPSNSLFVDLHVSHWNCSINKEEENKICVLGLITFRQVAMKKYLRVYILSHFILQMKTDSHYILLFSSEY